MTSALCSVPGPKGPVGVNGPPQAPRLTGATGPTGPASSFGPMGVTGPVGSTGMAWPKGAVGATGATGPQGFMGATGPTGPAGPSFLQPPPPEHHVEIRVRGDAGRLLLRVRRVLSAKGHVWQRTGPALVCDLCCCSVHVDPPPRGRASRPLNYALLASSFPSCLDARQRLVDAVADR